MGQTALRVLFPCSLLLREFSVVERIPGWEGRLLPSS